MPSSFLSGPISYRLGNQRRLKYAPPPDLTSNASKQYSAPVTQPLLAAHNSVATPSIFNPNESVGTIPTCQPIVEPSISTNSPSLQLSTPEYLSQANSLQESFRSSPVAISGAAYNSTATSRSVTPQNQNSNLGVPASTAQPIPRQVAEPTTPQNTPANVNYFGYDTYGGQRDFPPRTVESSEKGAAAGKNRIEAALQIPKEESEVKSGVEAKPSVTFAPVSAVQVTEKLEHLLAEREEVDPSRLPCDETSTKVEDVSVTEPVANYDDAKLTGVEGHNDLSSNVFSRKEGSEITHSTIITCQEANAQQQGKFNGTQSRGVSSNVRSAQQQYYQPQPFLPSSAGFFAEVPDHRRSSNLTYNLPAAEASPSTSYNTDPSKIVTQSASSFFNKPESNASFPVFQYKENTANARELDVANSRNDSQQAVCNSPIDPTFADPQVPRSSWDTNRISESVIATCNPAAQSAQQPLFYDPAQFQDELPKQIPTYTPPPATSLTTSYFDNFAGSTQATDITSGIGNFEFPPAPSMTVLEPTGSATLNPVQMSINPLSGRAVTDGVPPSFQNLVNITNL